MKTTTLAAAALPAMATAKECLPWVTSEALQEAVTLDDLLAGSQQLQDFADANGGTRSFGSAGHNATVDWLYDTLVATGAYNVEKQPFTELFHFATGSVTVDGEPLTIQPMTYTPGAAIAGPLVNVPTNFGCAVADYPAKVAGKVAFVGRGACPFSQKALNAAAAGAVAVIVYNNEPGMLSGTLGTPNPDYAAAVGISQEDSVAILAALAAGEVTVDFNLDAVAENRVNYNVIAETRWGDHDNVLVLGGHSDSVQAGPGINDDGSGTIGVLNVALALAKFKVKNAVRFAFWGAEEFGKLGSYYYVMALNGTYGGGVDEVSKMRAYLNFDMIASPNYIYGIYDGDGSAFNVEGPAGSDVIEKDFETFYESYGLGHVPSEFTGRSDYAAFIENGIPSGGIFTGAEVLKTEEEAALFGGEAGVAYDINYHQPGDTVDNLNHEAYLVNTKSIAYTVAKYSMSWDSLPAVDLERRRWDGEQMKWYKRAADLGKRSKGHGHGHAHAGPCGGGVPL
ncbi:aminopeptidase Y [Stachybotrys elegans]|uniref:Peptide hydrolase n=1 Tax=Stachybotrys elegans TaxID=80388 RepID=A0A8K0WL29_9HYPO|nr:aminopeptidase Y [Stachybotrys elegans]